jgi:acetyl esterase/lipase
MRVILIIAFIFVSDFIIAQTTVWQPTTGHDQIAVQNSLVYFIALKKAGVPVEYHVFPKGGHAFGLRKTDMPVTDWPRLAEV